MQLLVREMTSKLRLKYLTDIMSDHSLLKFRRTMIQSTSVTLCTIPVHTQCIVFFPSGLHVVIWKMHLGCHDVTVFVEGDCIWRAANLTK